MQKENIEALQQPDYDKILQRQDFFPKIFLIPSQIKLDKTQGLKIIKRRINHPDKYEEQRVMPININQQQIKLYKKINSKISNQSQQKIHPAGHGLLSLFKKTPKRRIKLAICICVYSQPKHMLKSTIKGIQQSYKHFKQKAGILPHQIILIVIFDGIQKINASKDQTQNMISFFNQIDIKNGFVYKPYGRSLQQYLKQIQQRNFDINKIQNDKGQDISLFTQQQLSQLKIKLFENQYNEYIRIGELKEEIQKLKKQKNIRLQLLPQQITKKYEQISLNYCIQNNMYYQTQQQIQQYLSTKRNIRIKLVYQAINQTQLLCKRYLQSRQDKAILYPVRLQPSDFKNPRNQTHVINHLDLKKNGNYFKQYNYMFFVVKHKNQGKLSSHMLFFQGFCKLFDPEYCMLTDVGIKPHNDAIYRMWAHMEQNPKCGGVCGYMGLKLQNPYDDLGYREDGFQADNLDCLTKCMQYFFTVQRAQQFQYHFAHMLDKPFQAAFGYIHVLPGAFSGYRWKALKSVQYKGKQQQQIQHYNSIQTDPDLTYISSLQQDQNQQTIMKRYLKIATAQQSDICLEDLNMYLAEDRIMCLGIHALGYDLDYLPDAESTVDPVTSLTRLLGQRRRWINGSWFAFNYVRNHSFEGTSWLFFIQLYYYVFIQKLSWIGPAMFYIALNLTLITAVREYVVPLFLHFFNVNNVYQLDKYSISILNIKNIVQSIPDIINFIYILLIFSVGLYSLLVNHNNRKFKQIYYLAATLLGIYGMCALGLLGYNSYLIIKQTINHQKKQDFIIPLVYLRSLIIFILVGHALPILWTFNPKKYIQIITSLFSYLFYTPTYVNILQIFAFCRIDDLSWGTKGLDVDGVSSVVKQWQKRKYIFVLQYITTNVIIAYICIKISEYSLLRNCLILGSACLISFLLIFRLIPALIYLIKYYLFKICNSKFTDQYIKNNLQNGMRILNVLKMIQFKIKQIQKNQVKKKKQAEYKKIAYVTSEIFSKNLSNFGNKIRSKVAQHMVNNNVIPKRQILDRRKKLKKKIFLRKKLKTVEQVSNEQSEQSKGTIKIQNTIEQKNANKINYNVIMPNNKKNDIRAKLQMMKNKKSKVKSNKEITSE